MKSALFTVVFLSCFLLGFGSPIKGKNEDIATTTVSNPPAVNDDEPFKSIVVNISEKHFETLHSSLFPYLADDETLRMKVDLTPEVGENFTRKIKSVELLGNDDTVPIVHIDNRDEDYDDPEMGKTLVNIVSDILVNHNHSLKMTNLDFEYAPNADDEHISKSIIIKRGVIHDSESKILEPRDDGDQANTTEVSTKFSSIEDQLVQVKRDLLNDTVSEAAEELISDNEEINEDNFVQVTDQPDEKILSMENNATLSKKTFFGDSMPEENEQDIDFVEQIEVDEEAESTVIEKDESDQE